ncbi:hypothetical protein [Avibacterium paragallinarum]|uniref:hypothetical protein n=1 Tax=Avibacterium paragallinarum TaxID=728 RepID=UPI00397BE9EF
MSELFEKSKAKICLEIEFDEERILDQLSFSSQTQILGGTVTRVDFTGDVFSEVDMYRNLFDGDQMAFLVENEKWLERAKKSIYFAFSALIEEIKTEQFDSLG